MTTKEKLEKALAALKEIADTEIEFPGAYAADVYEELTTPLTEEVEVKRWEIRNVPAYWFKERGDAIGFCNRTATPHSHIIELTGSYQRPIPEPEVWEGEVLCGHKDGGWLKELPNEWIGKRVIVEVCE